MVNLTGTGDWPLETNFFAKPPRTDVGTAAATIREPRHPRGEDRRCGDGVTCATVEVIVAQNDDVLAIRREAAEEHGDVWYVDPQQNLGWCWWEDGGHNTLPDGRVRIWATLKNWSHNRARRARITVWTA